MAAPTRKSVPGKRERGVAMLMAVVAITILTVVATEFAFNSRVDLQMSTNERDELRAFYIAKSGIGLSRMLLRFQKQLDSMPLNLPPGLSQLLGMGAPGGTPTAPGMPSIPGLTGGINIQLWQMAKIDCHMLSGLVVENPKDSLSGIEQPSSKKTADFDAANPELAAKQAKISFGGFDGCFDAHITPEEPKLNINKLDMPQFTSQVVVARMLDMFSSKQFDFLFQDEDANHVKTTPQDLVIAIHDWIDEDETQGVLNLQTGPCMSPTPGQGEPFVPGFADESSLYDKYIPRYRPKNFKMDTLDELYMVPGWNDKMMAAFRDRLTVYPDINTPPNINTDDPVMLWLAVMSVTDPLHPDPRLCDPVFVDALITRIKTARMFSFFGMSVNDFVGVIQSAGVAINPSLTANLQANRFISDKNFTYTITSTGQAGNVEKTLTAVVRMDDNGLGRLLYWKEQ